MRIKYKSKLPLGSDDKPLDGSNQEFAKGHTPTRAEELAQKAKDKEFGDYSDIEGMLIRDRATLISNKETLPKGDMITYTKGEWQKLNEKSFNSKNNTYYSWH